MLVVCLKGSLPLPRDGHASALLGNKGYISGGLVSCCGPQNQTFLVLLLDLMDLGHTGQV